MPKNTKRMKNSKNKSLREERELIFKEPGQEYCQVKKMLGAGNLKAYCFDGKERLCIIRRRMCRGRINRIKVGDIILVTLREFQDEKADIILRYSEKEVNNLIKYEEIVKDIIEEVGEFNQDKEMVDIGVDFVFEDEFDTI
jgi:translation initiation factor 1A